MSRSEQLATNRLLMHAGPHSRRPSLSSNLLSFADVDASRFRRSLKLYSAPFVQLKTQIFFFFFLACGSDLIFFHERFSRF